MNIGDTVRRDTNDRKGKEEGQIIAIAGDRARVKWPSLRTWYAINRLILVAAVPEPEGMTDEELAEFEAEWGEFVSSALIEA